MIELNFLNLLQSIETIEVESWDPQFRVREEYINNYQILYKSFKNENFVSVLFKANNKVRLLRKSGTKFMLVDFYSKNDFENEPELLAWICADALKCTGKAVKRDQIRINSIDCNLDNELAALTELEAQMQSNSSISLSKALKRVKQKLKLKY